MQSFSGFRDAFCTIQSSILDRLPSMLLRRVAPSPSRRVDLQVSPPRIFPFASRPTPLPPLHCLKLTCATRFPALRSPRPAPNYLTPLLFTHTTHPPLARHPPPAR